MGGMERRGSRRIDTRGADARPGRRAASLQRFQECGEQTAVIDGADQSDPMPIRFGVKTELPFRARPFSDQQAI